MASKTNNYGTPLPLCPSQQIGKNEPSKKQENAFLSEKTTGYIPGSNGTFGKKSSFKLLNQDESSKITNLATESLESTISSQFGSSGNVDKIPLNPDRRANSSINMRRLTPNNTNALIVQSNSEKNNSQDDTPTRGRTVSVTSGTEKYIPLRRESLKEEVEINPNSLDSGPPLPKPVFEKKKFIKCDCILRSLERFTKGKCTALVTKSSMIVQLYIKEQLLEALSIPEKIKNSLQFECSKFLSDFLEIRDAEVFYERAKSLEANQKLVLANSIGGQEVFSCLELCTQKSTRNEWKKFVKAVKQLGECTSQLSHRKMAYPNHFDEKNSISHIRKENILSTFRSMCSLGFTEDKHCFVINGKWNPCPVWGKDEQKNTNRETEFIEWLIRHLNRALGQDRREVATSQATVLLGDIVEKTVADKWNQEIKRILSPFVTKVGLIANEYSILPNNLAQILQSFEKADFSKHFLEWLKIHFTEFSKKSAISTSSIIAQYEHHCWLQKCAEEIPCFRILQSISFSAYTHADTCLRTQFCPMLIQEENWQTIRMKYFPKDTTQWSIETNTNSKTFVVTHIKPYRFIKGDAHQYEEFGTIDVHWRLQGNTKMTGFTAQIWCENIKLLDTLPLENRFEILKKLGLSKEVHI